MGLFSFCPRAEALGSYAKSLSLVTFTPGQGPGLLSMFCHLSLVTRIIEATFKLTQWGHAMRYALITVLAAMFVVSCSEDEVTSPEGSSVTVPSVGSTFVLKGWQYRDRRSFDSVAGTVSTLTMGVVERGLVHEGKSGVWRSIITDARTGLATDTLYMCYDANQDLLILDPRRVREINSTLPDGARRLSWIRLPVTTDNTFNFFSRDTIVTTGVVDGNTVTRRVFTFVSWGGGSTADYGAGPIQSKRYEVRFVDALYSAKGVELKSDAIDESYSFAPALGVLTKRDCLGYTYAGKQSNGRYFELQSYTLK